MHQNDDKQGEESANFASFVRTRERRVQDALADVEQAKLRLTNAEASLRHAEDFWGGVDGWAWMLKKSPISDERLFRENFVKEFGSVPEELEPVLAKHFGAPEKPEAPRSKLGALLKAGTLKPRYLED